MNYPEYTIVNGRKYLINTGFRYAIKCDEIARDTTIDDYERSLAVLYLLFGDEVFKHEEDLEELTKKAKLYLLCGEEPQESSDTERDMDYIQDMNYIEASFMSDYQIDLNSNQNMHWWKFQKLMNGLSNSDMGNCCVLNRIRNLRNLELSEIKDEKQKSKMKKAKDAVRLKKHNRKPTDEQIKNSEEFWNQLQL